MDKIHLRNTLRKLRQIPFDRSEPANAAMVPQEMLDFLAMLAGLKPVYLAGRGFDDPDWVAGITELARKLKLHVTPGPFWAAEPEHLGMPDWYPDFSQPNVERDQAAFYIMKTRNTAAEVGRINAVQSLSIAEEARLLGYPECCVVSHYKRGHQFNAAFHQMLLRVSGGDIDEMKRIVREDVPMKPETSAEISAFQAATHLAIAPYTSFYMCSACEDTEVSPARQISASFESLARTIDPTLADEISAFRI